MKKSAHIVAISVINCCICEVGQTRHYILEDLGGAGKMNERQHIGAKAVG
jgi:hypothetical protein